MNDYKCCIENDFPVTYTLKRLIPWCIWHKQVFFVNHCVSIPRCTRQREVDYEYVKIRKYSM
jgi:hypothetical protein